MQNCYKKITTYMYFKYYIFYILWIKVEDMNENVCMVARFRKMSLNEQNSLL